MDQQIYTRYCQVRGHDENKASYIQIYKEGQQTQKLLCADCILQYFDNNGQPQMNHMMKQKLFLDFIKQQTQPIQEKKNQIQICIQGLQQFLPSTQSLLQQLQEDLITIDKNYNIKKIEEIINITIKDHNLLKNQQIDILINLDNCKKQYEYNLSFDLLQQLIQHDLDLQKLVQNKDNNNIKQNNIIIEQVDSSNKIIDLKNRKYIAKEIDQTNSGYSGSSISKNQQYLAYGGYDDFLLKIYNIKQKKIIKEIKLDNNLHVCQFTQDSSQLYVGLREGYVHGYNVQDDFKEIYKQQIHSDDIYDIITIQNEYLITCSYDQSIIKTDIKSKQKIFKLTGHTDQIIAIDFNDKDEIIVSGSDDKSIKLWNCRNQCIIINKEQSHNNDIIQIQLINNNLNILSLDHDGNLYKWKIDLTNKNLVKIQQFSDQNKIINFYQVNQDQNLLLICNNYAKILNQQGETINTIEHGGQRNEYLNFICRQLDNLKYIQIRAENKIILAIAQD